MPTRAGAGEVVAAIGMLAAAAPGCLLVGIDGFGGAGKSTLAARVADAVPRAQVVHIDDFWGPRIPEWDWERFEAQVLAPLRHGQRARYQDWDWDLDLGGEWIDVAADAVLVVEGVSCTRAEVDAVWAITVWVEAPREIRLARALERDGATMLVRWLEDWMPSEEAYAARERPWERVTYIVDGTGDGAPSDPGATLSG
jgi:uridine kinase